VAMGIDVDSLVPRPMPPAGFGSCVSPAAAGGGGGGSGGDDRNAGGESHSGKGCAKTLLGPWVGLKAGAPLPTAPADIYSARLWNQLIGPNATTNTATTAAAAAPAAASPSSVGSGAGSVSFRTSVGFYEPPPNNSVPLSACPCAGCGCVHAYGFRSRDETSTILLLVNLDPNRTYVDAGLTGRALHYLHRR
jgi:hypothetical protein